MVLISSGAGGARRAKSDGDDDAAELGGQGSACAII
jgi:hypothetical protein